jgi:hypothetical protein
MIKAHTLGSAGACTVGAAYILYTLGLLFVPGPMMMFFASIHMLQTGGLLKPSMISSIIRVDVTLQSFALGFLAHIILSYLFFASLGLFYRLLDSRK